MNSTDAEAAMTAAQVARIFQVTPATVKRWADTGRIPYFLTPGGHYRFRHGDVSLLVGTDPGQRDAS